MVHFPFSSFRWLNNPGKHYSLFFIMSCVGTSNFLTQPTQYPTPTTNIIHYIIRRLYNYQNQNYICDEEKT